MSTVTVAATQMACSWDRDANMARAEKLIREAARRGANVVLIQELFETPYFCKDHASRYFDLAKPLEGHPAVELFRGLAR
jgi:N-carbamoylputrescine amidase